MKKNGFTLVELLAVIVILAIILAIAIPSISGVISSSTGSAFESDAKMVLKTIDYKLLEDSSFNPSDVNETSINTLLNVSNNNYQTIEVFSSNDKTYIIIQGKNKWDGLKACGTYIDMKVVSSSDTTTCEDIASLSSYDESKGVNKPALATGMTPIKWNGTTWNDTTASDSDWYNYDTTTDKKWANAKTADGSMWVWIPRYIYKISSGWHTSTAGTIDVQFSKGTDDNWNSGVIGNIDTGTTAEASNNKWTNHPAFDFGDTKLTGIWVAKFEASGTTSALNFKPNETSLYNQTIGTFFSAARNMETNNRYGWGTTGTGIDTHMMKNTEWGAVAYLAKSTYGKNVEIWINNSNTNITITGCAGNTVSDVAYNGCQNAYNTANGQQASTTGNIYGVYDMSGGSWEYTAAYIDNGHTNLNNGSTILSADSKYKDVYTKASTDTDVNNYALAISHKGDAIYETSSSGSGSTSWYGDYSGEVNSGSPWFGRGGYWYNGSIAGAFSFAGTLGNPGSTYGFRPVLIVNAEL